VIRVCALCHRERPLCESHIVPNWMYQKVRDRTGRAISLTVDPRHRPKPKQDGWWEHLLCIDCEGTFSRWERVGSRDVGRIVDTDPGDGVLFEVPGVDQRNLALLAWSILWRVSVSRRLPMGGLSLGTRAEELRGRLYRGDLAPLEDFPLLLTRWVGSEVADRNIIFPFAFDLLGMRGFRMQVFGIDWFWSMSPRRASWLTELPWVGQSPHLRVVTHPTDDREVEGAFRLLLEDPRFR
jgi:hypothetical protein